MASEEEGKYEDSSVPITLTMNASDLGTKAQGVADADTAHSPSSIFWAFFNFRQNGLFRMNLGFPGDYIVNDESQIVGSMTELNSAGVPFLGLATMQVLNIAPQADGTAQIIGQINWNSPLNVRLNLIIVN